MSDIAADPFQEQSPRLSRVLPVMGCRVRFESNSHELLKAAGLAFAGLKGPRTTASNTLRVALVLEEATGSRKPRRPPRMTLTSGAGLLTGVMRGFASVTVDVAGRRAMAVITRDLLAFPYHLQYEVIELVTLTLAARVQRLVPLHAACVARGDRAVLLLGDSGAGKSTLSLLAMAAGLQVVAEDSAFITTSLRVHGASSRLHVHASSIRLLSDAALRRRVRRAPVIERRSGARKHAMDLRAEPRALAKRAPRLIAVLVLSSRRVRKVPRLKTLPVASLRRILRRTQPYAVQRDSWREFERQLAKLPAHSSPRGPEPGQSVSALMRLLGEERI